MHKNIVLGNFMCASLLCVQKVHILDEKRLLSLEPWTLEPFLNFNPIYLLLPWEIVRVPYTNENFFKRTIHGKEFTRDFEAHLELHINDSHWNTTFSTTNLSKISPFALMTVTPNIASYWWWHHRLSTLLVALPYQVIEVTHSLQLFLFSVPPFSSKKPMVDHSPPCLHSIFKNFVHISNVCSFSDFDINGKGW